MDQIGFTTLDMASPDSGRSMARDDIMVKFIARITTTQLYKSYFNHISTEEDYDDDKYHDFKEQYEDSPEESNCISSDKDNYSEKQKLWMCIINHISCSTDSHIDLRVSKHPLFFTIELKNKGKGNIKSYGCSNTSVSAIRNGFIEF